MQFDKDKPIYTQIVNRITENILQDKWKAEERIPSVRELAVSLEVNPNTVVRSYNYLQDQNIIYNQRGIGYFVTSDGKQQARIMKRSEFIQKELPYLFKTLRLLDMSIEDIEKKYKEYIRMEGRNEN